MAEQNNTGLSLADANIYNKLIEEIGALLNNAVKTGAAAGVDSEGIGLSYLGERIRLYLAAGNEKVQMLLKNSKNNTPLLLGIAAFAVIMAIYLKKKK